MKHIININLKVKEESLEFVKTLTGIGNSQEALEHFTVTCMRFSLDPKEIISKIKVDILEGYETT